MLPPTPPLRVFAERVARNTCYGMPVLLISDISDHAQCYGKEIT